MSNSKIQSLHWKLLALVAALLTTLALTSTPAQAVIGCDWCQGPGTAVRYYKDATMLQNVGFCSESCEYNCYFWGQVSPYSRVVDIGCS